MEPGVPFAILGAVQILLVVASVGMAAAGALRRTGPGVLVAVGGILLAAVEIRTTLQLGIIASDNLELARAGAALVLAAGLYSGGLGPRRVPTSMFGVVVPLAAAGGPAVFATAMMGLAAAAVLLNRNNGTARWLASGFALWALASAATPLADSGSTWPLTVILARGLGALTVLVGLTLLARRSLLSKVVSAILAGVVTMAIAAVGVVGTVVVSSYDQQTRSTVQDAATARLIAINNLAQQAAGQAVEAAFFCSGNDVCGTFLQTVVVNGEGDFLVRVRAGQAPESFGGRPALSASELLGLRGLPAIQAVLTGHGAAGLLQSYSDKVRLTGPSTQIAVIGVGATARARPRSDAAPREVWVYGTRIDDSYASNDLDFAGGFNLSLLAGDPLRVVASNDSPNGRIQLLRIAKAAGVQKGIQPGGMTIGSQGSNPTVALQPVLDGRQQPVALLAMTRSPGPALKTERDALRLLLVTSLLALVAVAAVAVAVGRRTVDPVRRLTAAARRVAAGDLTASADVRVKDEVGTLSRTFDEMTGSLVRLTDDLRGSAGRLGTVLASITDGLLATDGEGTVTSVNRAALGMLGVEEDEVVGESLEVVADVRSASGERLRLLQDVLLDEPAEVLRPDGSRVPVRVVVTPLAEGDGVVLVLRDTTREREVERMKTEFLSNVSHELRTPLTPIRGYAEILATKPNLDPDRVKTFATTIRDESLKMNRVVDLLVDVAAIEAGRVQANPKPVAVRELLDARRAAWAERAGSREVKRRVASGLPRVMVDSIWLAKALDELIDNAVKYATGTITLVGSLTADGDRVRVAVRDNGPGIAAADQVRLFTSFEQVDGSATRRVGGLGLGLSFVRQLAEDAGFLLTVTSGPTGSEFSLDLPIA
jgi:two-component system sensor histidine kinase VicK